MNLAEQARTPRPGSTRAAACRTNARWYRSPTGSPMAHSGMRFSLISRELIADSVEATMRGHQWDGIFGIGACDKNLPGLMMGMVRCNVPSVFVLRRLGAARTFPRQRHQRRRDVRKDRPGDRGRRDRGGARADQPSLPAERRRLPRPVHRQHHGHGVGSARTCAARLIDGAGGVQRTRAADAQRSEGADARRARRRPAAARPRDAPGARERMCRRIGHRRLDQRRAAYPRDRA